MPEGQGIQKAKLNDASKVDHIIAIHSGKGGVGKSYVTSLIAVALAKKGYKVGIMDADITGPSIPKSFGLKGMLMSDGTHLFPAETKLGIKIVSSNLLLEKEDDAIIWRGPMLSSLIKQFYEDVLWEDIDYLLIDMPPGTADVTLSVFQLLNIDKLFIVSTPQDLVSLIVKKAINMAWQMNVPVTGIIENMSYVKCPNCDEKIYLYGNESQLDNDVVAKLPLSPENAKLVDEGKVEDINEPEIDKVVSLILEETK